MRERMAQLQREAEEEAAAQERDEQAVLARRRGVERARRELDQAAEEHGATREYVASPVASGRHDQLAALRARDRRRTAAEAMEVAEAAEAAEAEAAEAPRALTASEAVAAAEAAGAVLASPGKATGGFAPDDLDCAFDRQRRRGGRSGADRP